jgi:hypothetical protein
MPNKCPHINKLAVIEVAMNTRVLTLLLGIALFGCKDNNMGNSNFKAERVSKSASFIVNADIDKVFSLFGAFEERKWAPHWEPILIYPDQEVIEEGTTFKVSAHGHGPESEYLWVVSKFDSQDHLIQYLVSTLNRFWTITVHCERGQYESKTKATVSYSYTGLNEKGNELNRTSIDKMYKKDLSDWADAINSYLDSQ